MARIRAVYMTVMRPRCTREALDGASRAARSTRPVLRAGEPSQISQAPARAARAKGGQIPEFGALADDVFSSMTQDEPI